MALYNIKPQYSDFQSMNYMLTWQATCDKLNLFHKALALLQLWKTSESRRLRKSFVRLGGNYL